MKVFVVAEGIGYGHMARILPLLDYIKDYRLFSFGNGFEFAKSKGYEVEDLGINYALPEIPKDIEVLNYVRSLNVKEVLRFNKLLKEEKPDVLISDSNALSILLAKANNIKTFLIANGTDLSIFSYNKALQTPAGFFSKVINFYSDHIFIPDFPPPYTISWYNIKTFGMNEKFHFIGPMVRKIGNKKGDYKLISFGGTDTNLIKFPLDKTYVSTLGLKGVKKIEMNEYMDYFKRSKVIISHGGHSTIMESILSKKPMVLIYSGNYAERDNNIKRVDELELGKMVYKDWLDKRVLEKAIEDALEMKKNIKSFYSFSKKFNPYKEILKYILV